MTFETETVLDRRRLRRRIGLWRGLAVVAALIAVSVLAFSNEQFATLTGQKQIARIAIEGTIYEDRKQLKMLKKIAEADHVSALLVYVNSPGGTTTGGEALYNALRQVAEKKPVVAQFGTLAASAGYIIGLGADHIVARGNTITGSVGVLVQWPQVTDLLDKVGVKFHTVRSGEQKARPNLFEDPTFEDRRLTQAMIDESFQWFLSLVEGRRKVTPDGLVALKSGRTFLGREAIGINLVDEIGGETEAIKWLETKRKVPKDLDVIDWKKESQESFGIAAAVQGVAGRIWGPGADTVGRMLQQDKYLSTLGLDGLLSVWHPSEN